MKAGRKDKAMLIATQWLERKMANGPVPASEIKAGAPVSWRTMNKCKKWMNLDSKMFNGEWWWYRTDKHVFPDKPVKTDEITKAILNVKTRLEAKQVIEFDPDNCLTTQGMIDLAHNLTVQGKSDEEIIQELILSCDTWPMPYPYPKEYIKSVFYRVFEGQPLRKDLNKNEGVHETVNL